MSEKGRLDERTRRQAVELQSLLGKLIEPPTESHEHPLPDVELSPREVKLLVLLGDQGEMIMTDLASALQAPLSTVTRIVDRLENKSMVERSRSEQDRRIVVVKESSQGKLLHDSFRQHQLEIARRMLDPLSSGEREILLELMAKMVHGMSALRV